MNTKNQAIPVQSEIKEVMRAAMAEIMSEAMSNFGAALFGGKPAAPAAVSETPPIIAAAPTQTDVVVPSLPAKNEFAKIAAGYLHMTMEEMGCECAEIDRVVRRFAKKIESCDYSTAKEACKAAESATSAKAPAGFATVPAPAVTTQTPIVIMGLTIPTNCCDIRIADLKFKNERFKNRSIKALSAVGIKRIRDFRNHPKLARNLKNVRNMGVGCVAELFEAIKNAAGVEAPDLKPKPLRATKAKAVTVPEEGIIGGVKVPADSFRMKIGELKFKSRISRTKLINSLQNLGIVRLEDFFKPENLPFNGIKLSAKGRNSLVDVLRDTFVA